MASRRDAIRRRTIAEARLNAAPDDAAARWPLEEAVGEAGSRPLAIERHLPDLTIRAVGHGSVRMDDLILTVATRAGTDDPEEVRIDVAEPAHVPTLA